MNLFYQPLIPEGIFFLDPEESRHCVKVLRRKSGDAIRVTDGKGFFYDVVISKADARQCSFDIRNKTQANINKYTIHIAISPTKNTDRIEWFVEKAVELGIDKITLIACENAERSFAKTERLEKIAISAMKQSLKAKLPTIEGLTKLDSLLLEVSEEQEQYIAYVDNGNPDHLQKIASPQKNYIVLIGPEGDFSPDELTSAIAKGFKKVSLGKSRLRTETAGLAACHILNLINV